MDEIIKQFLMKSNPYSVDVALLDRLMNQVGELV